MYRGTMAEQRTRRDCSLPPLPAPEPDSTDGGWRISYVFGRLTAGGGGGGGFNRETATDAPFKAPGGAGYYTKERAICHDLRGVGHIIEK